MSVRQSAGSPGESPANPAPLTGRPAPALAAFLRGVERRGAVLAELQSGDAQRGDAALARAMRRFLADAGRAPMGAWPRAFWTVLMAEPDLRRRAPPVALELDAADALAQLGAGPRAAVLLRLAAGLDDDDAAAALGVPVTSYRLALQRAERQHRARSTPGSDDAQAWQRLREQVHRRIKTLPPPRLVRLASAREAALAGAAEPGDARPGRGRAPRSRPGWLLPLLWALLALCAVAFAATFRDDAGRLFDGRRGQAGHRELPPEAPASRYGRDAGLVAHRDFELLADPQALADVDDLAFNAWLATQDLDAPADEAPSDPDNGATDATR